MENAYLRMGRLEYSRGSGTDQTQFPVYVDRYIGEKDQAHLLSIFGNDAEVGAITAAIHEDHKFDVIFPDGSRQTAGFGKEASCHKGALRLPDEKRPLRHLIATSIWLQANGSAGNTFVLNYHKRAVDLAWSTLVSLSDCQQIPVGVSLCFDRSKKKAESVASVALAASPLRSGQRMLNS